MAAAAVARDDSMLQLPRRLLRKSQSRVRNIRQARDTRQRLEPRQDVPEGVAVTTLILTETLATPSATLTQILTLAPSSTFISQRERIPSTDDSNDHMPESVPTSSIGAGMQTSVPNSATVHTSMGRTVTTSSPTVAAENGPASTTAAASGSSGPAIDIKALVPAIVGGAIFLIIVAFLFGYCIRRRGNKAAQEDSDPEVVNEIDRGYGGDVDGGAYGTAESRRTNEKQPPQAISRSVPDINVDSSHARNRSLSKGTSQSKEGLLQSDYGKLGPTGVYTSEPEKRHAIAMFRRSTAQDSATIPHHLRHLRPESVSTDPDGLRGSGLNHMSDDGEHYHRAIPMTDRISKIGMALSTSDKSVQDDNISAVIQDTSRQPEPSRSIFQQNTMYFEDTPPLYSLPKGALFGAGAASSKPGPSSSARDQPPEFGTVGSGHSSNQSRFAGRSDIATPSPPGTPTRPSNDRERDPSTSSRRSSRRGSGIFGLAAATMASGNDVRKTRPKSWDRKSRRWDKKRHSRGRVAGVPAGLEKRKGNKSRSRSRNNTMWTAWFDSSSEGEDNDLEDVVEPIPLPGGIVTSKSQSQRKKRVIFNSTSDISENPTVSSARTLTNSQ
ncbi:hypothetical protein TWF481_000942 [Arthrobotrys musiformis]|uniref:Mid2 domain-containing protein n=1 Tax=Arthrobotrys musiformis TaxID=47236 RepID=A0AAV9WPY4_9PEZI